jgi:hypothetical protein
MKRMIFIILNLILSSCILHKPNFYGNYEYNGIYGVYHGIELFPNSTFTYRWRFGLIGGVSLGTYKIQDGNLILIGGKKPEPIITVEEKTNGNRDSIYIKVIDFESTPLGLAAVKINDQTMTFTDIDGKTVSIKNGNIDQIKVSYLGLNLPEYKCTHPNSNYFVFKINHSLDRNVYFDSLKVGLFHDKIFLKHGIGFIGSDIILKKTN